MSGNDHSNHHITNTFHENDHYFLGNFCRQIDMKCRKEHEISNFKNPEQRQ